mgnify:CR=1 FL=1
MVFHHNYASWNYKMYDNVVSKWGYYVVNDIRHNNIFSVYLWACVVVYKIIIGNLVV